MSKHATSPQPASHEALTTPNFEHLGRFCRSDIDLLRMIACMGACSCLFQVVLEDVLEIWDGLLSVRRCSRCLRLQVSRQPASFASIKMSSISESATLKEEPYRRRLFGGFLIWHEGCESRVGVCQSGLL